MGTGHAGLTPSAWLVRVMLTWLTVALAAPYQLCNFSCGDGETAQRWLACRAEKCTPRLPEDACSDGNEAVLHQAAVVDVGERLDGAVAAAAAAAPASTTNGLALGGPQECGALRLPHVGSFGERCDLCMTLVGEAVKLARLRDANALREAGAAALCDEAAALTEATLPTMRTCRLHPPACATALAAARERACPDTWEKLVAGASSSAVRAQQQQRCGELLTQRNGSGVDDAMVCAVPRDVGARVMAVSAVVATAVLLAQAWLPVRTAA